MRSTSEVTRQSETLEKKLDPLLTSIFGADTVEYQRYLWAVTRLDTATMYYNRDTHIGLVREGLRLGVATSRAHLEAIKAGFLGELGDAGQTPAGTGGQMSGYDVAQVCLNGHAVNARSTVYPESNQDFCSRCGKETITSCLSCRTPIRGKLLDSGLMLSAYHPPAYCIKCGNAYPWTEATLSAARELVDELEDSLSADDREQLKDSFDDLVSDTPRTVLATSRFNKRLATKAGVGAASALREILVDIVSETAKKTLWPGS